MRSDISSHSDSDIFFFFFFCLFRSEVMQLIFSEKVTQNLDVWTGARFFGNLVTVTRISICYSEQLKDIVPAGLIAKLNDYNI